MFPRYFIDEIANKNKYQIAVNLLLQNALSFCGLNFVLAVHISLTM